MATNANSKPFRRLSLVTAGLLAFAGCQPPGPKALLEGEKLMAEGKLPDALDRFATATQLLPQNAQAWNHLGLALHRSGRPEESLKAYQRAIQIDRNLAPARYNLGVLHYEQGRFGEAANELTTYTALQPAEHAAWVRLADSLFRAKRIDEAERAYVAAYRLNQTDPETLNGLGLMQLQRRRVRDAQGWFQASLKADPDYPPALFNMAVLHHHYIVNKPLALQNYKEYAAIQPPAENAALAAEMARQLEAELYPRPATNALSATVTNLVQLRPLPTNAVPVLTNPPVAKVQTNAPATVKPPPATVAKPVTNPPPVVVAAAKPAPPVHTNTAPVTPPKQAEKPVEKPQLVEKPAEKPPVVVAVANPPSKEPARVEKPVEKPALEVVPVKDEDPIAPVKDVPNPSLAAQPPQNPAPSIPQPQTPDTAQGVNSAEPTAQPSASSPIVRKVQPREKKSIWAKANPKNWFGGKPGAEQPSVQPIIQSAVETPKPATPPPAPLPLGPYNPPASMARYAYRNPVLSVSGNRTVAEPFYARGAAAQQEGNLLGAIELYRRAIQADSSYFEPRANLGLAAFQLRDYPQALYYLEEAVAVNPASTNARYNFALALQAANYPYDATLELKKLLQSSPGNTQANFLLGTLYSQTLNSPPHAVEYFRKVLELEPEHAQAAQIRRWLASYASP